jgi:hypothetical protein
MTEVVQALDSSVAPGRLRSPALTRASLLLLALGLIGYGCSTGTAAPPATDEASPATVTMRAAVTALGATTPPSGTAWGRSELCDAYCSCMGSGKCTGRSPSNCLATCMNSASNWNIPCRIEKCKSANKDYADQVSGSCATAAGIQGCWDRDKLIAP